MNYYFILFRSLTSNWKQNTVTHRIIFSHTKIPIKLVTCQKYKHIINLNFNISKILISLFTF